MIESKGRGVLDITHEPFIGLAEGDTRWRGMTTVGVAANERREMASRLAETPSYRGDAKHRTRKLEMPGLVLAHHPGMTASGLLRGAYR